MIFFSWKKRVASISYWHLFFIFLLTMITYHSDYFVENHLYFLNLIKINFVLFDNIHWILCLWIHKYIPESENKFNNFPSNIIIFHEHLYHLYHYSKSYKDIDTNRLLISGVRFEPFISRRQIYKQQTESGKQNYTFIYTEKIVSKLSNLNVLRRKGII